MGAQQGEKMRQSRARGRGGGGAEVKRVLIITNDLSRGGGRVRR